MKKRTFVLAGLLCASLVTGSFACDMDGQEREELRSVCTLFTFGKITSKCTTEVIEGVLLKSVMDIVRQVPRQERADFALLVTPWLSMESDHHFEFKLRLRLIEFLAKLAPLPSVTRTQVMTQLNTIVDLSKTGLVSNGLKFEDPLMFARQGVMLMIGQIEGQYLKSVFDIVLPLMQSAPENQYHLALGIGLGKAKETLGITF